MVGPSPVHQTRRMKTTPRRPLRLEPGVVLAPRVLNAIDGSAVVIPDPDSVWVHLQFRRYAGCPICSLHLRSFAQRHEELQRSGIREIAVFHSTEAELRKVHQLPFAVIADPLKELYAQFGVGTSPAAVLDPRVWPTALRAVAVGASAHPQVGMDGGAFGLPADFLIAPDGRLTAAKYGVHGDDQWSFDELLALTRAPEKPTPLQAST